MQIRTLGLTLAASILLPASSNASGIKTSLHACVDAFEKSLAETASSARRYKVVFSGDLFDHSIARFFSSGYTLDLAAHDPRTGKVYARARCVADSRKGIASLSPLPIGEGSDGTSF